MTVRKQITLRYITNSSARNKLYFCFMKPRNVEQYMYIYINIFDCMQFCIFIGDVN